MSSRSSLCMWSLVSVLCILCVALGLSCSDDEPTKPDNGTPDTTPPAAVSDLAAGSPTASSITLTWTAVGDDSLSGTADRYDIRYTADSLATWEDMTVVSDPPDPKPAGDAESFVVTGLGSNTTYHFQIKVADEVPNWSGLSNPASAATGGGDPGTGMIWIPAGNVRLGQTGIAEPVHDVWLDGFWIGKYEVTNGEYAAFIAAGGYTTEAYWNPVGWAWRVENDITLPWNWDSNEYHGGGIPGNEQFPVNGVSWWEADAYCRWAGGRLPTEAEREKAAKGPSPNTPTYPWGEEISGQRANYWESGDPYENNGWTTPVGFYDGSNHGGFQTIDSPSPYGLYDMAGNVWEWCSTKYANYPYDPDDGREDPPATSYECCRVLRGGSWGSTASYLRCAYRNSDFTPHNRSSSYGFRCASN